MSTGTPTVTTARLDANERDYWHKLTEQQRGDICDLIAACGFDDRYTAAVEYDVIDCPLIRLDLYCERDGQVYLNCEVDPDPFHKHDAECRPVTETVERPAPSLPTWWKPQIGDSS